MDPVHTANQASSLVEQVASYGILGVVTALAILFAWNKDRELKAEREARDRELKAEREARITDAKAYTDLALKLQERVIGAVNTLSDIADRMAPQQPTLGNSIGRK